MTRPAEEALRFRVAEPWVPFRREPASGAAGEPWLAALSPWVAEAAERWSTPARASCSALCLAELSCPVW